MSNSPRRKGQFSLLLISSLPWKFSSRIHRQIIKFGKNNVRNSLTACFAKSSYKNLVPQHPLEDKRTEINK